MSPLLYQLSYTARAAKLTTYGDRVKRGGGAVPGIVPDSQFASRVLEVGGAHNIVAIKDGPGSVSGDSHGYGFRDAQSD